MDSKQTKTNTEKDKILKYCTQKFFHEGFYKTSMEEIAKELQISKKTIYKYFQSKVKLVEEITEDNICRIDTELLSIIDARENVVWKFVHAFNKYNRLLMEISDKYLRDVQIHTPHIWQKIDKFRSEIIYSSLNKLLDQGKKENLVEKFPNEIILISFINTIHAVMAPEFISKNNFSTHQAFSYTFDILMYGILTQQGVDKYNKMKQELKITT